MLIALMLLVLLPNFTRAGLAAEDISKLLFAPYGTVTIDGTVTDSEAYMDKPRYGHLSADVFHDEYGLTDGITAQLWLANNQTYFFVAVEYNKTGYVRVDLKAEGSSRLFSYAATVTNGSQVAYQVYIFERYDFTEHSFKKFSNLTGQVTIAVAGKESGGITTVEFAIPLGTSAYVPGDKAGKYVGEMFLFFSENDSFTEKPNYRTAEMLFYTARDIDDLEELEEIFFHSYDFVYILSWTLFMVVGVVFVVWYYAWYVPKKK